MGHPHSLHVEYDTMARGRESRVHRDENELRIIAGRKASVSPDVTLENWFRKQARTWFVSAVHDAARRLHVVPGRLFIMNQQTKWRGCSAGESIVQLATDHGSRVCSEVFRDA